MRKFYQKHRQQISRLDNILLQNPVLERGLTLAPVVVAGNTMKNGLALGIAFCIITVITVALTYLVPQKMAYTFRVIINALLASLVFIPTALLIERLFPGSLFNLGIYLPLLVTNSLIVQKSGSRYHKMTVPEMAVQLICSAAGFMLVILLISAIRELVGYGTFLGNPVQWMTFTVPSMALPFGGFLLTGFLAAAVQALRGWLEAPADKKETAHE
ncbi:MAG: NADH:ubiquinone oxidoreductase subunit RnfE [Oscillospiraceae bacterium]|nr:NADH:ubiquinone oxidoreductase subunit RnfE [Oscillospiraceae bacterium]